MIRTYAAAVAYLSVVSCCQAARLLFDIAPTPNLPGYTTYKLSIELEGSQSLRGLYGDFRGPMNQMTPAGNASIFHLGFDPLPFIPFDLTADSHFWFWPQSILAIGASESGNHLTAAISGLARLPINNPTLFAQIVTNNPAAVSYDIDFDLGAAAPHYRGFLPVPEPHSFILTAGLFISALARRHRD